MTALQMIFYLFSAMALVSGLMVVISRNPVHAALFLVLTFVASAGLWMLLQAEFLALILVLVYVGAVMTLFLFVVMMLSMQGVMRFETFVRYLPISIVILFSIIGLIIIAIDPEKLGLIYQAPALKPANYNNISSLGLELYTRYAFPFEVAAALLLSAIIAAIGLTHRPPMDRKVQKESAQIAVQKKDRVRLIKMPSEKKKPIGS